MSNNFDLSLYDEFNYYIVLSIFCLIAYLFSLISSIPIPLMPPWSSVMVYKIMSFLYPIFFILIVLLSFRELQ